jgi:uncharacterized cupin superfamily protein
MTPTRAFRSLLGRAQGARNIHVHLTTLDTRGLQGRYAHQHKAEEAMYFLEGEAEYAVGGASHRVGPGDLLFFPSGIPHGYVRFFSDRMRYLVIRSVEPGEEERCCCDEEP